MSYQTEFEPGDLVWACSTTPLAKTNFEMGLWYPALIYEKIPYVGYSVYPVGLAEARSKGIENIFSLDDIQRYIDSPRTQYDYYLENVNIKTFMIYWHSSDRTYNSVVKAKEKGFLRAMG